MNRLENTDDLAVALLEALDGRQALIWTAMPATVIDFNPDARTASLQVTVQALATNQNGVETWLDLPPLLDCPVLFPGGKGLSLTFPLDPGDEVLVLFASRCIDNWWQSGGIQRQAELRMHDLSDGFCFPQPLSLPNATARAPVSMDAAELRNAAGTTKIRLMNNGDIEAITPSAAKVQAGSVDVEAEGAATVSAATATINAATINLNGVVVINGEPYLGHQHVNVTNGPDTSGGVA